MNKMTRRMEADSSATASEHKKLLLPHGWVTKFSRNYPDKMYYFNVFTKSSTWERPLLEASNGQQGASAKSPVTSPPPRRGKKRKKKKKKKEKPHPQEVNRMGKYYSSSKSDAKMASSDQNQGTKKDVWKVKPTEPSKVTCEASVEKQQAVKPTSLGDGERLLAALIRTGTKRAFSEPDRKEVIGGLTEELKQKKARHKLLEPRNPVSDGQAGLKPPSTVSCIQKMERKQDNGILSSPLKRKSEQITSAPVSSCVKVQTKEVPKQKAASAASRDVFEKREISASVGGRNEANVLARQHWERAPTFEVASNSSQNEVPTSVGGRNEANVLVRQRWERPPTLETASSSSQNETGMECAGLDDENAMEWETSEDQQVVMNILQLRQKVNLDDAFNQVRDVQTASFGGESSFLMPTVPTSQDTFVVLDTNVFISNLSFVQDLRDTVLLGVDHPVIVVPWIVLQELDVLKDLKGHLPSKTQYPLMQRARAAIRFLQDSLQSKHPRVKGQSAVEASEAAGLFASDVPDDRLIQCCVQIAKQGHKVVLLSNDRNVYNKAAVHNIEVYSKDLFEKEIQKSTTSLQLQTNASESSCDPVVIENTVASDEEHKQVDSILCKLRSALKMCLSKVVEVEMEKAYGDIWKMIVCIKPPWTLSQLFTCILKHWIAVFGFIFKKDAKLQFEKLNRALISKGYGQVSLEDVEAMLISSWELLLHFPRKDYGDEVAQCLNEIGGLKTKCKEAAVIIQNLKANTRPYRTVSYADALNQCVKALDDIMLCTQQYVGIIMETLGLPHGIQINGEVKKMPLSYCLAKLHVLNKSLVELINNMKRVMNVSPESVTKDHAAVKDFYDSIFGYVPTVADNATDYEVDVNIESLVAYCKDRASRERLAVGLSLFQEMRNMLERCS